MINMRTYKVLALLFVALFFCMSIVSAGDRSKISGSATAEKNPDGTVTTRKPTASEISSLDDLRNKLKEIDHKYPGPEIPKNLPLLKVTSVDNNGIISLENGQRIQMEGVKCSAEVTTYLQKTLIGESDKIAYVQSSPKNQNPVRAFIWHATLTLMNDPELKKFNLGPGYSPLNETALTSGWCAPERSSSNAYNDRYEALSKITPNR